MAGSAVVPYANAWLGVWSRFLDRAEFRIREGNLVAGEQLWEAVKPPDAPASLVIRSAKRPTYFIECTLNAETGVLTSRCGTGPALRFELFAPANPEVEAAALEEAVTAILDQLEWSDDAELPTLGVE